MSFDAHLETDDATDERGHARHRLRLRTIAGGDAGHNVTVLNLSESGLLLETGLELAAGDSIDVTLPHVGARRARVIWSGSRLAGCKFDRPLTRGALSAARLNAGPAGQAEVLSFGARLRELRKARGMSIEGLAKLVGVTKLSVLNWEKDKASPRAESTAALAEVLRVTPEELAGHAAPPEPERRAPGRPGPALAEIVDSCRETIAAAAGVEPGHVDIAIRF